LIGNNLELNYLISIANVIVLIVLIPTVINKKSFVPRLTSIPTVFGLVIFAFVFFDEGLIIGGSMEMISAFFWVFIVLARGK
jgi:hypothetical protein